MKGGIFSSLLVASFGPRAPKIWDSRLEVASSEEGRLVHGGLVRKWAFDIPNHFNCISWPTPYQRPPLGVPNPDGLWSRIEKERFPPLPTTGWSKNRRAFLFIPLWLSSEGRFHRHCDQCWTLWTLPIPRLSPLRPFSRSFKAAIGPGNNQYSLRNGIIKKSLKI